jgi:hypothetical protein
VHFKFKPIALSCIYSPSFGESWREALDRSKRLKIVKDECWLRENKFVENVFLTTASLHNFRLLQNAIIMKQIENNVYYVCPPK